VFASLLGECVSPVHGDYGAGHVRGGVGAAPVMYEAASEQRKATVVATSCGSPTRPSGCQASSERGIDWIRTFRQGLDVLI